MISVASTLQLLGNSYLKISQGNLTQLPTYTALAVKLLRESGGHESLVKHLHALDSGGHKEQWRQFADMSAEVKFALAPLAVATSTDWNQAGPGDLLIKEMPADFHWRNSEYVILNEMISPQSLDYKVRIAQAFQRQVMAWSAYQAMKGDSGLVSREKGVLLVGRGDWVTLQAFLMQQADATIGRSRLFYAFLTSPHNHSQREALMNTAGFHPRLGDLSGKLEKPIVTFPPDAAGLLVNAFEHVVWNPTGETMHDLLPVCFENLVGSISMMGATKAFGCEGGAEGISLSGRVEHFNAAIKGSGRVFFNFQGGFSGAKKIIGDGELPYQDELSARGMHLAIVGYDQDDCDAWARSLTAASEFDAVIDNGLGVHRFVNRSMAKPLIVDSYAGPAAEVMEVLSVWKNAGSLRLGRSLFREIYQRLLGFYPRPIDRARLVGELVDYYKEKEQETRTALLQLLEQVEGFEPEQIKILTAVDKDERDSWEVRDMGALVDIVQDVFFSGKKRDGLKRAIETAIKKMPEAFATRNPVGGFGVGFGVQLLTLGLVNSIWDVVPKKQYEGRTTLEQIGLRLEVLSQRRGVERAILRARIPNIIQDVLQEVLETSTPTALPRITRQMMADFSAALSRLTSKSTLAPEHVAVLMGTSVDKVTADDVRRWESVQVHADVEDLRLIIKSLAQHIARGRRIVNQLGPGGQGGAREFNEVLTTTIRGLIYVRQRVLGKKVRPLTSRETMKIISAVMHMVNDGDYLYSGVSLERVFAIMSSRLAQIILFIEGHAATPHIMAGDPLPAIPANMISRLERDSQRP